MPRKRKPKAAPAEETRGFEDTSFIQEAAPEPEPSEETKKAGDHSLESIARMIGQLEGKISALETARTYTPQAPAPQTTPAQYGPQQRPVLDLTGMPDPVTETEAYQKELAQRIQRQLAAEREFEAASTRSSEQLAQRGEGLWEDFQERYSDYADLGEERVEFAATAVARDLTRRGINPVDYMTYNRDQFFRDVTARMDKVFGKPDAEPEPEEDEDDGRTQGLFGGDGLASLSGKATQKKSDFIREIQDVQRKSGLF